MMSMGVWALCIIAATIVGYELFAALNTKTALQGLLGFRRSVRPLAYWASIATLVLAELLLGALIFTANVDGRMIIR